MGERACLAFKRRHIAPPPFSVAPPPTLGVSTSARMHAMGMLYQSTVCGWVPCHPIMACCAGTEWALNVESLMQTTTC
jgi:hypothetical protein